MPAACRGDSQGSDFRGRDSTGKWFRPRRTADRSVRSAIAARISCDPVRIVVREAEFAAPESHRRRRPDPGDGPTRRLRFGRPAGRGPAGRMPAACRGDSQGSDFRGRDSTGKWFRPRRTADRSVRSAIAARISCDPVRIVVREAEFAAPESHRRRRPDPGYDPTPRLRSGASRGGGPAEEAGGEGGGGAPPVLSLPTSGGGVRPGSGSGRGAPPSDRSGPRWPRR